MILLGDINIVMLQNNANRNKINFFVNSNGLTQLIKSMTRCTNTGSSLIDHMYTNNTDFYERCGVYDPGMSDHAMVYVPRKQSKPKQPVFYIHGEAIGISMLIISDVTVDSLGFGFCLCGSKQCGHNLHKFIFKHRR